MKDCCIVIPTHKEHLSNSEYVSLCRLCKVLGGKYDIFVLCPEDLNLTEYYNIICKKYCLNYNYIYFDKSYFEDFYGYNILMTTTLVYDQFQQYYKYSFIYLLDCYIFRDELTYWIDKDLDQIECVLGNFYNGEGLRKNKAFYDFINYNEEKTILFQSKILVMKQYNILYSYSIIYHGEDIFFFRNLSKGILHPEARNFGISEHYKDYIDKNGLPMMIHYFGKNDVDYQKQLIGDWDTDPEECINKEFEYN